MGRGKKETSAVSKGQGKKETTSVSNKKESLSGTVKPAENFNAEDDAKRIRDALDGWGTDEGPLIDILSHRSNAQRQQIKEKYKELYDKVNLT